MRQHPLGRFFSLLRRRGGAALFALALPGAAAAAPAQSAPGALPDAVPDALTVVVRDSAGRPAAGARVFADAVLGGERAAALTDASGAAAFPDLPPARYLLSASLGDTGASPVEADHRAGAPPVELVLRFAAHRESVVVSAALAPRPERESGQSVDALTAAELRGRGEWAAVEALRGLAGVWLRQTGGPGTVAELQVRGLPGSATAVVVDGAPLRDTASITGDSAAILPSLDLLGVARLELRRGGGATLYGTNAMGGVLQVVTRRGAEGDAGRLSAELGTAGQAAGAGEWGAGGPRGGVFASFGERRVSAGATGDDRFRNRTAGLRLGRRFSSGLRLSGRAFFSDAEVGLSEEPFPFAAPATGVVAAAAPASEVLRRYDAGAHADSLDFGPATFVPAAADPDAVQGTRLLSTLVSLSADPTPNVSWTLRFHDLATRRENTDGPAGRNPWDPPEAQTISYAGGLRSGAARIEVARGAYRWLLGGEAERERARTEDPAFAARLRQSALAAFAQGEARTPGGRASLRGALRLHRFRTAAPELEPREGSPYSGAIPPPGAAALTADASASVAAGPGLSLHASWGRGFRAPSLYERFGTWYSAFGYSVFGDPTLEPERASATDAGFAWESADGGARLRAAAFHSRRPQVIAFGSFDPATDPFGRTGGYRNDSAGTARGFETDFGFALPGRVRARLTYTRTAADPPEGAPPELPSAWLLPLHQGGALFSGAPSARFAWSADLHLSSALHAPLFDPETFATRVFRFSGMRRLDLAASFEVVPGLTLRAVVEDAFDDGAYQSGGFRPLGRAARVRLEWRGR